MPAGRERDGDGKKGSCLFAIAGLRHDSVSSMQSFSKPTKYDIYLESRLLCSRWHDAYDVALWGIYVLSLYMQKLAHIKTNKANHLFYLYVKKPFVYFSKNEQNWCLAHASLHVCLFVLSNLGPSLFCCRVRSMKNAKPNVGGVSLFLKNRNHEIWLVGMPSETLRAHMHLFPEDMGLSLHHSSLFELVQRYCQS